jgi:hypothetical protein
MPQTVLQRAFIGGELAPALGMRADLAKYITGLATCRNFIVQRHGGVAKRPGTQFIKAVKTSSDPAPRLVPFIFEAADQTYLLEFGHAYVRFYWHGAIVESSPGVAYEVSTPYAAADVADLQWTQSADTIVLTHPSYAPRELKRTSHTSWALTVISFLPSLSAPGSVSVSAGTAGAFTFKYKVTAVKSDTYEESLPSSLVSTNCATPTPTAPNRITAAVVSGAIEYNVYLDAFGNGMYGLIGSTPDIVTGFKDVGFVPDLSQTPPENKTVFASSGNYPAQCCYYQQRLWFARTTNEPEKIWGSQIASFHNFTISTPLQDDDSVEFVLNSAHLNPVRHLIPLKALLVLSDEGAWTIKGDDTGTVRPTAINADQENYNGSAEPRPVVNGNALVYVQARGSAVRSLKFAIEQGGFAGADLSIFATHLFAGYSITALAFQELPDPVVWAVRSDGVLLGLTYVPEQDVWGWHRHDTDGTIETIAVLPDTTLGEDVLYLVVKRSINGSDVRYVEKLMPRQLASILDAFFVDAGLAYAGSPASSVSGLSHLEGEVVAVFAGGQVIYDGDPAGANAASFTVSGGSISLGGSYRTAVVGMPIRFADIETLDLDVQGSSLRDKRKLVVGLSLQLEASSHGFYAGPDSSHLIIERAEAWESGLKTGLFDLNMTAAYEQTGRVFIRSTDPTPLTILGLMPSLTVGG